MQSTHQLQLHSAKYIGLHCMYLATSQIFSNFTLIIYFLRKGRSTEYLLRPSIATPKLLSLPYFILALLLSR